jgi:hypothetical protein
MGITDMNLGISSPIPRLSHMLFEKAAQYTAIPSPIVESKRSKPRLAEGFDATPGNQQR